MLKTYVTVHVNKQFLNLKLNTTERFWRFWSNKSKDFCARSEASNSNQITIYTCQNVLSQKSFVNYIRLG